MYRIQTDARVITENTTEIKTEAIGRGFLFRGCISRNHEGEVCILFKWMLIKTDRGSTTYFRERLSWRYCLPTAAASTCRTPASICRTTASICRTPALQQAPVTASH